MELMEALQPSRKKSKKTIAPYKEEHGLKFGIKPVQVDTETKVVVSCVCRFCTAFGREPWEHDTVEDATSAANKTTRKTTTSIHYHSTFRTDLYKQHLMIAHSKKWSEYERIESAAERDRFFDVIVPHRNTLGAHFSTSESKIVIALSERIVEGVIGGLLLDPDDGVSRARALSVFTAPASGGYSVAIKAPKRFSLLVGTVALGSSFRQAARIVSLVRDETKLAVYSGCSDALASTYCRVVCAASLQHLSELLICGTGFSLAFDSATLHSHSYLDVRVRFWADGDIQNFHLLALPLHGPHTAAVIFEGLQTLLDAVCDSWRKTLVGVATDGEPKMTGRVKGVATLIEAQSVQKKVIRVWCGLHQLDLVMQRVYKSALDGAFLSTLTGAIGHLRRQQLLITDMHSICPKVADTRWTSMFKCTTWLTHNIIRIQEHYANKRPRHSTEPEKSWWVFMFAIHAVAMEVNTVFVSLQASSTLLSQQRSSLQELVSTLSEMAGMQGGLTSEQLVQLCDDERNKMEISGSFFVTHGAVESFLIELDPWIEPQLNELEPDAKKRCCRLWERCLLLLLVGYRVWWPSATVTIHKVIKRHQCCHINSCSLGCLRSTNYSTGIRIDYGSGLMRLAYTKSGRSLQPSAGCTRTTSALESRSTSITISRLLSPKLGVSSAQHFRACSVSVATWRLRFQIRQLWRVTFPCSAGRKTYTGRV